VAIWAAFYRVLQIRSNNSLKADASGAA